MGSGGGHGVVDALVQVFLKLKQDYRPQYSCRRQFGNLQFHHTKCDGSRAPKGPFPQVNIPDAGTTISFKFLIWTDAFDLNTKTTGICIMQKQH